MSINPHCLPIFVVLVYSSMNKFSWINGVMFVNLCGVFVLVHDLLLVSVAVKLSVYAWTVFIYLFFYVYSLYKFYTQNDLQVDLCLLMVICHFCRSADGDLLFSCKWALWQSLGDLERRDDVDLLCRPRMVLHETGHDLGAWFAAAGCGRWPGGLIWCCQRWEMTWELDLLLSAMVMP